MVEYGLLIALIGLVVAGGTSILGQGISAGFDRATAAISGTEPAAPEEGDPQDPDAAAAEVDHGEPAAGDQGDGGGDAEGDGGAGDDGGDTGKTKGKSADAPGYGDGSGGGRNH